MKKDKPNLFGFSQEELRRTAKYNQAMVDAQNLARKVVPETKEVSAAIAIEEMEQALTIITKGNKKSRIKKVLKNWEEGAEYYKALAKVYPR